MTDLTKGNLPTEPFDLLVFSACFPYSFEDWNPLLASLGDRAGQATKMILAIEPDAKRDTLVSFHRRLAARSWRTMTFCCHDLPGIVKDDTLPLPEIFNVWQRLGLDGAPKTWWNPPNDKFLVANSGPTSAVEEDLAGI
jgi:hypothetical protein